MISLTARISTRDEVFGRDNTGVDRLYLVDIGYGHGLKVADIQDKRPEVYSL
jgi:hypothetical protein